MIAGVRGKVVGRQASSILLEVGGFVLQIGVPLSTLQAAGERGASVYLHTYLHLRADAMSLFGFSSEDELTAFLDLLNVNGVGPKVALAILSRFDPKQLERIIGEGEPQNLSTVSGVGKKLAGRIVLELHGKLEMKPVATEPAVDPLIVDALMSLGYRREDSLKAAASVERAEELEPEQRILRALRYFQSE